MPNLFNNQYANLASMGRYGDTMLAHINPQEAGLLKSMGGAGTINPQTGLPEFYGQGQINNIDFLKEFRPDDYQAPFGTYDMRGASPPRPAPFDRSFANIEYTGKGAQKITGYTIPSEKTFGNKPLVAKYDEKGNFKYLTMEGDNYLTPDPSQPNILSQPRLDASGNVLDYGVFDINQQDDGGFGSFLGGLVEDFGPMIALGLGANFAAGNLGSLFAGGAPAVAPAVSGAGAAVGSGALSPFAAQAAGAYGAGGAAAAKLPAAVAAGGGLLSTSPLSVPTGQAGADVLAREMATQAATQTTGSVIAGQIASQGTTPSLIEQAAKFLNVKPETLTSLAPSVIQGLLSAGGSYLTSEQAKGAAQTQADAQVRAAQIAADAARFRPVGVTTRFGSSNFTTDAQGNVIGAGYTPSAEIKGYQDRLSALANQGLTGAEGAQAAYSPLTGAAQNLFSLGQSYLAKTPEQAAQDYITKQQALLAPSQEKLLADVQNKLFQQGRIGSATAQGGNLMNTNPEMAAYYNSIAQQNLVLAANADQEARNRITFGSGLFDTGANLQNRFYSGQTAAYSPFATAMDTSSGLERLAQQPLDISRQIGGQVTAGAASAGNLLSQGITSAAGTMAPANAYSLGGNLLAGAANSNVLAGAVNKAFGNTQPTQQQYTFNPTTGQYVPVQQFVA